MTKLPQVGDIYQHYKGEYYQILLTDVLYSGSLEPHIVYCSLKSGKHYIRNYIEFLNTVNIFSRYFESKRKELGISYLQIANILQWRVDWDNSLRELNLEEISKLSELGFDSIEMRNKKLEGTMRRFTFICKEPKSLEEFKKKHEI